MRRLTRGWLRAQTWVVLLVLVTSAVARPAAQSGAVITEYYHVDAAGSLRVVTNQAGQVDRTYDYGPFGELDNVPCTQTQDARLYTGQERDRETCLDYFGARYYRATSGRFLTMDPVLDQEKALLDPQQWNRYAYARNNPTRFIDPDGRVIGTLIDLYSLYWSAVYVYRDPASAQHWGTLILDAVGVVMPFLPSPGHAIRAVQAMRAARALEATRAVESAAAKVGRLGNQRTRQHVADVANEMESRGYRITGGGGRGSEEYIPGATRGQRGSAYPDITATKGGRTVRVNTVDTRASGAPTTREANNAARIRSLRPSGHLLLVPKPKR